jgi:hypothetical protein
MGIQDPPTSAQAYQVFKHLDLNGDNASACRQVNHNATLDTFRRVNHNATLECCFGVALCSVCTLSIKPASTLTLNPKPSYLQNQPQVLDVFKVIAFKPQQGMLGDESSFSDPVLPSCIIEDALGINNVHAG